ncbi:MAG: hypothetical protein QW599_05670 [Nitrososphaerota archaeon]
MRSLRKCLREVRPPSNRGTHFIPSQLMEEELIRSAFIHIAGLEEGRELRPGGTSNMLAVAMLSMLSLLAFARLVLGL